MVSSVEAHNRFFAHRLPGLLGMEFSSIEDKEVVGRLHVTDGLIAGTGFLFASAVVGLADLMCAGGTGRHLPDDVTFTTVELTTNFIGTARVGETVVARATPAHVGRSTQVWDATVTNETTSKPIALFRCTQLVLRPT